MNYIIRYNGQEIKLNPQSINGSAKDSYFNLNDLGLVTPVKNQGSMGSCWAFGAAGSFESAYLVATGMELDISENNIQNLAMPYTEYGQTAFYEGGDSSFAISYFMGWLGAINASDEFYDELGKISALPYGPNAIRAVNAVCINISNRTAIKEHLAKYGAMDLTVYGANPQDPSYSNEYNSIYNTVYDANHDVTLVGWDDAFPKSHFSTEAPGDGAWICKNSWGTGWGDGGYFYVSYYDKALNRNAVGFIFDNVEYYEKLYQNEIIGYYIYNGNYSGYGQTFASEEGDLIAAVGTYFEKINSPYEILIYVNGSPVYNQSGNSSHAGYETVKLNRNIIVSENSTFEIRISSSTVPIVYYTRSLLIEGTNYAIKGGEKIGLAKEKIIAPIRAYTFHYSPDTNETNDTSPTKKATQLLYKDMVTESVLISVEGRTGKYFNVTLVDENMNPLANKQVKIGFNGKIYNKTTDEKGVAKLQINLRNAITYTFAMCFLGDEEYNASFEVAKITVIKKNLTLTVPSKTYKASAKTKTLTATLKDKKGNFISGKMVTFTVNGKTYSAKTNSKGVAKVNVSLSSKKTYSFKVKYAGDCGYNGVTKTSKLVIK